MNGLEREKEGILEGIEEINTEAEQIGIQLAANKKSLIEYEELLNGNNIEHEKIEKEIETIQNEYKYMLSDKENILNELTKEKITLAEKIKGLEAVSQNITKLAAEKNTVLQRCENYKNQSVEIDIKINETDNEIKSVKKQIEILQNDIKNIKIVLSNLDVQRKALFEKREGIEASVSDAEDSIASTTNSIHRLEITASKLESEVEVLQNKLWDEYELTIPQSQKYRGEIVSVSEAVKKVNELKSHIRELGEVNVGSIEEYKRVTERYSFLTSQKDDLLKAEKSLLEIIEEITLKMKKQFEEKFEIIRKNFNNTFRQLFGGGVADLKMEDDDILNCGIDIIVQPPGKKLQSLMLLSGGEKGLAAIALIFAILKMKPTPFCVLDEIEASLDDANVNRFAEFLVDYSNNTQFIIITHRKGSMAVADALYGVTMEEKGISKSISLKLNNRGGL
jgi:chromosome segregation protein